jgi:hypothetical protein
VSESEFEQQPGISALCLNLKLTHWLCEPKSFAQQKSMTAIASHDVACGIDPFGQAIDDGEYTFSQQKARTSPAEVIPYDGAPCINTR